MMKHGRLRRVLAWEIQSTVFPYIPTSSKASYCIPLLPHISQRYPYTHFSTTASSLPSRTPHSLPALSAKCLPRLRLVVVVRVGVVTDVAHQLRPVLRLEITYPSKTLQTLERIILLREQTIPLQRYESTYSPSRPKY